MLHSKVRKVRFRKYCIKLSLSVHSFRVKASDNTCEINLKHVVTGLMIFRIKNSQAMCKTILTKNHSFFLSKTWFSIVWCVVSIFLHPFLRRFIKLKSPKKKWILKMKTFLRPFDIKLSAFPFNQLGNSHVCVLRNKWPLGCPKYAFS